MSQLLLITFVAAKIRFWAYRWAERRLTDRIRTSDYETKLPWEPSTRATDHSLVWTRMLRESIHMSRVNVPRRKDRLTSRAFPVK